MHRLIFALVVILFLLFYIYYYCLCASSKSEKFAPYASILIPEIVNSTAGFDSPNQYGEILNPYQEEKDRSSEYLFNQTHRLSISPF